MQDPSNLSYTDLKRQQLKENCVIIRIWTSECNISKLGEDVGHISIETPISYHSFWPELSHNKGITNTVPGEFKKNYMDDRILEGRDPEYIFYFYTLNVSDIASKFQEIKETQQWSLVARPGTSESCASSAWKLLIAGGIYKLVSPLKQSLISSTASYQGSSYSSNAIFYAHPTEESTRGCLYATEMVASPCIKSPDFIGKLLQEAKKQELKNEPLTESFDGNKLELSTKIISRCCIM